MTASGGKPPRVSRSDGHTSGGVLKGISVVEMDGLGPSPFCAMMLADMGADVVRVERPAGPRARPAAERKKRDTFGRGRRSMEVDVKTDEGRQTVAQLAARADVLIEGFRPGVMERLGLGPEALSEFNPGLIYARMSGWGQTGPMASTAGHDVNYISIAGALEPIGRDGDAPVIPLSVVGDFGGGGMYLAVGILGALVERFGSGVGQVVDASCAEGSSHLMSVVHHMRQLGRWSDTRGSNLFDTGAPFYEVYRTADDLFISVGAVEPKFYEMVVRVLDLPEDQMYPQYERDCWPARKSLFAAAFSRRDRDDWVDLFSGVDACVTPVLSPGEVAEHPQMRAREAFVDVDGFLEPAPTPRFSRTPSVARPRPNPDAHAVQIREELRGGL